jgi:hypothetical protein
MEDDYYAPRTLADVLNSWLSGAMIRGVVFLIVAVFICGGYAILQFHGLRNGAAMGYSEVARNAAQGAGFSTRARTPFDVWYLKQKKMTSDGAMVPDLHHAPGYPALLALVYKVTKPDFGAVSRRGVYAPEYKSVVPLGVLLTIICAVLVFVVGRSVFGEVAAGLAAVIYLVSNLTLSTMISGLPLPLLTLAVIAGFGCAMRAAHWSTIGEHYLRQLFYVVLSAVFAAAAVMADYSMLVVAVGFAALLWIQQQRLRWVGVLLFVVVCGALLAPWMLHNHNLGLGALRATPYDALSDSVLYPADTLARSVEPQFNSYRVAAALRHKIMSVVAGDISGFKIASGGIIICFFVLALFHRFERLDITVAKWWLVITGGALAVAVPLIGGAGPVMAALFPLAVLLGSAAFIDYLDSEEIFDSGMHTLLVWVLVIASALPALAAVARGGASAYPPYYAPIQGFVCSMIKDDETLVTDIAAATAWYGGKKSLLLPNKVEDVAKLLPDWKGVGGMYLTLNAAEHGSDWQGLLYHKVPEGVPFKDAIDLPPGNPSQIFLSDAPRWQQETPESQSENDSAE